MKTWIMHQFSKFIEHHHAKINANNCTISVVSPKNFTTEFQSPNRNITFRGFVWAFWWWFITVLFELLFYRMLAFAMMTIVVKFSAIQPVVAYKRDIRWFYMVICRDFISIHHSILHYPQRSKFLHFAVYYNGLSLD